jgi:hypothetical protein
MGGDAVIASLSTSRIEKLARNTKRWRVPVLYLCYVLFAIGVFFYGAAAFFIGDSTGETLSDFGNAVLLFTTVLLLLRLSAKRSARAA